MAGHDAQCISTVHSHKEATKNLSKDGRLKGGEINRKLPPASQAKEEHVGEYLLILPFYSCSNCLNE